MNWPVPVNSRWSSSRLTGWPAPKRILPGRMFIRASLCSSRHSGVRLLAQARNDGGNVFDGIDKHSTQLPQYRFDHLAFLCAERRLWWKGIADVVALDLQAG